MVEIYPENSFSAQELLQPGSELVGYAPHFPRAHESIHR
jgi:hypothetical protein